MSLDDVITQYPEELKVFEIVKDDVNYVMDVGCRENYEYAQIKPCLLYTSPSPRDATLSRMPSSA